MRSTFLLLSLICLPGFAQSEGPAFEAASLKVAPPQEPGRQRVWMDGGPGSSDPGRLVYDNVTLKAIFAEAYDLKNFEISGPDWLDTNRYNLVAKIPNGSDWPKIRLMLQRLLAERFQAKVHREAREQAAFALVTTKGGPKLKKSEKQDCDNTINMRRGHVVAQCFAMENVTVMLSGVLHRPVLDKTGIEGRYDFVLDFEPEDARATEAGPAAGERAPIATAIQDQLGLKLEGRKASIDTLVIDSALKIPVEN